MPDYEPLPKPRSCAASVTPPRGCAHLPALAHGRENQLAHASCRSSCALAGVDLGLPVYGRSWAAPDEPLRRSPEGAPAASRPGSGPGPSEPKSRLMVHDGPPPSVTLRTSRGGPADRRVSGCVAVNLRCQIIATGKASHGHRRSSSSGILAPWPAVGGGRVRVTPNPRYR